MRNPNNKPFVVVSGIIGAGKSTLTARIADYFYSKQYPCEAYFEHVEDNPYLGLFYECLEDFFDYKEYVDSPKCSSSVRYESWYRIEKAHHIAYAMQTHLLTKRYQDHKRIQYNLDAKCAIQDRSIFEDGIFVRMLNRDGVITDLDKAQYDTLYGLMSLHLKMPDYFIYLKVSPETALDRIKKRSRTGETSITLEYLKLLDDEYNVFISDIGNSTKVDIVDWNDETPDIKFFIERILAL